MDFDNIPCCVQHQPPANGNVKDATSTHDLSNAVYICKCDFGNDYVFQTSQCFHVRREQHDKKKLKKYFQ